MSCVIPESRRAQVDRGLMAAFGTAELDSVAAIRGGLSAAGIFRIRVGGIAYLLRLEGERDGFRDPVRGYACMRTAAEAYIAPRVRYADAADGVAIMDYVAPRSLALDYPGAGVELVVELAQTVRALHGTPAFPPLVDYLDGMDALVGLQRAGGFLDPAATEELFARYAGLRGLYRTAPGDLVSSHNDLNPGNVLYDGTRLWLVDWESAFLADRYVDLAAIANWFTHDAEGEAALLATYFGAPPSAVQRARFEAMRPVSHLFYGLMFLNAQRPNGRVSGRRGRWMGFRSPSCGRAWRAARPTCRPGRTGSPMAAAAWPRLWPKCARRPSATRCRCWRARCATTGSWFPAPGTGRSAPRWR